MYRAVVVAAAAVLFAATPASAQERTTWPLVLNDEPKGEVQLVLTPDGPWIDPQALHAAGLLGLPEGRRDPLFGPGTPPWVLLPSLAPVITFTLDETEIQLVVTADPTLFALTAIGITNPRPPGWKVASNSSAFLNYSVEQSRSGGTTFYGEAAARLFGQLFATSALVDRNGRVTPGLTSWSFDQIATRRRWVVGDTIGHGSTLGSVAVVGGFSVSTEHAVDPYYATYPSPAIHGVVRTPTAADVYVDGQLVSRVNLGPGRFSLGDLPIDAGLGSVQLVLRDAFGREQRLSLGFYLAPMLLKRGEQEYSYVVGKERDVSSDGSVVYGSPVATMFHRVGLNDVLTIGGQFETRHEDGRFSVVTGGGGVGVNLWRFGVSSLEVLASSTATRGTAWAATSNYQFIGPYFGAEMRGTAVGAGFQNLYVSPADRSQYFLSSSASVTLGRFGSFSIGAAVGAAADFTNRLGPPVPDLVGRIYRPSPQLLIDASGADRTLRFDYSTNITSRLQLSLDASRSQLRNRPVAWTGFGAVNVVVGRRTSASSITSVSANGDASTSLNLQRAAPVGPGYGFHVNAETEYPYRSSSIFEVQGRHGVVGVQVLTDKTLPVDTVLNLAGGIVAIGGEVLMTRPIDDAFALVRVPNAKGVRVLANNEVAGRTSGRGTVFVPDLRSYLSMPIAIEPEDVPVNVRLGPTRLAIAVPARGGAVVTFDASVIHALTGRIDAGGDIPAFGTIVIAIGDRRFQSPLNGRGEFYFEDLPPGDHEATVTWLDRTCRATVRMPVTGSSMTDIGIVTCGRRP